MTENPIIWQPDEQRLRETAMYRFMRERSFDSYDDLYRWSIDHTAEFWQAMCVFCDVRFSKPADEILIQPGDMTTAKWFAGSQLSFAEHLLRHTGSRAAIVFRGEDGTRRELSWDDLRQAVAGIAVALR
ncbi:MAG: acetyl-coenzyme A synthetase N-terminal domain-containing protein, partial [Woeseia sp.]